MAKGKNEHRMLFDLRGGRRGQVVKVVYALLAVLMGLSLFLVIGGFNLAELFNDSSSTGDAAKPYEEQAERIEVKLKKDPEDPNLLLALTRAHVNAGNAQVSVGSNGEQTLTTESVQEYQEANQSWSEYLKATDEPSTGLALLMSPTLLRLAELSGSYQEASLNINSAAEAQKIVADERPSINSLTTLSLYTYFTGDFKAADKARAEAKKFTGEKGEREAIDKQLDEAEENARKFLKELKKAEKEAKAASKGGGAVGGAGGENPLGGLSGGGLGE